MTPILPRNGASGKPGAVHVDADGDNVDDAIDNCPTVENPDQRDADKDLVGDACNDAQDSDGDEWSDMLDNCPAVPNPSQIDTDGNGLGDACNESEDRDGDGWADLLDNSPDVFNPGQEDRDGDGIGDLTDPFPDDARTEQAVANLYSEQAIRDEKLDQLSSEIAALQGSDELQVGIIETISSEVLSLQAQINDLAARVQTLESRTADADGDGVIDSADSCPATMLGDSVDPEGCSLSQFCAAIDVSTGPGRATCNSSDWMNDEPRADSPEDRKATQDECSALNGG